MLSVRVRHWFENHCLSSDPKKKKNQTARAKKSSWKKFITHLLVGQKIIVV